MKKSIIGIMMAVTLVGSSLAFPVQAYAEDVGPNVTLDTNDFGSTVENNNGTVTNNNGTVTTNHQGATVTTNGANGKVIGNIGTVATNNGTVTTNGGTVENNDGTVTTNFGTVTTNNETVTTNEANGKVIDNNGTVTTNDGKVTTIGANGKVIDNNETVETNNGTVETNAGTVATNNGTVKYNNQDATVTTNGANGKVTLNSGTIETNAGEVGESAGTVTTNNKTVTVNQGTVTTNGANGIVTANFGTVATNNGTVENNNGTVENNNGTVENNDRTVTNNYGTVATNNGTVENNKGTVKNNFGTVENNFGGTVNGGTVTNQWYEYILNGGSYVSGSKQTTADNKTWIAKVGSGDCYITVAANAGMTIDYAMINGKPVSYITNADGTISFRNINSTISIFFKQLINNSNNNNDNETSADSDGANLVAAIEAVVAAEEKMPVTSFTSDEAVAKIPATAKSAGASYNLSAVTTSQGFVAAVNKISENVKAQNAANNTARRTSVTIYSDKPMNFTADILNAISASDIDFVFVFMHNGKMYRVTIPRGTVIDFRGHVYEGPLFIGRLLGTTEEIG